MSEKERLERKLLKLQEQHEHQHKLLEVSEVEKVADKHLTEMKKKKLAIKDQIVKVEKQIQQIEIKESIKNYDSEKILYFKQQLKKLKKQVKQMEAQREKTRSWNHKAELLEMKKQKLYWKDLLSSIDNMTDEEIDQYIQEHTLSTPLSEYEALEKAINKLEKE